MQTTHIVPDPRLGLATLGVLFASACFGLVPLFARSLTDAGMAPHAVALYRYVLATLVLSSIAWRWRHEWRTLLWGFGVGVVMSLGWVAYVRAVQVAPVSTVGVLYMTYPVFTVLFAWLFFSDRPALRAVIAALMIVAAAGLVMTPGAVAPQHVPALLLSLLAPAGFGLGISVLVHRLTRIPALARVSIVSMGSVVGLMPLIVATPVEALIPADLQGWWMVVGIGLATALVPQLIYTVCSPMVGTARTAIAGSVELPVMFLVGWAAFGEALNMAQVVACGLVILAIVLTPAKRARSVAATLRKDVDRD